MPTIKRNTEYTQVAKISYIEWLILSTWNFIQFIFWGAVYIVCDVIIKIKNRGE
jgi:hypothetical protein